MRVTFAPLSVGEYEVLFKDDKERMRGGKLSDISVYVPKHNRGGSLFSFLANVARTAAPLILKTLLPEGLNFARNIAEDLTSGQRLRPSLKTRGIQALKNVGKRIVSGAGKRKIKRVNRKSPSTKKKQKKSGGRAVSRGRVRYKDIFENA